jgi:hypothetical protein
MKTTLEEAECLSALIDQCVKILKESNERSEQIYAEIDRDKAERQRIIREFEKMLGTKEAE